MGKKSERPYAVAQVDHHHAITMRQLVAPVEWCRSGTGSEAASVNPNHHRSFGIRGLRRRPKVQIEAVFAYWLRRHSRQRRPVLHTLWLILARLEHAAPVRHGLRCLPSQRTHRRCGKWNALVGNYITLAHAAHHTTVGYRMGRIELPGA